MKAFPLSWPENWPRAKSRSRSKFGNHSVAQCATAIESEIRMLGARDLIISSNLRARLAGMPTLEGRDPGVAIYFKFKEKLCVLACDSWNLPYENLWAIAKHIEALRGQGRWCVGSLEQAFRGYTAIPEKTGGPLPWWQVLGLEQTASQADIKAAYRELAKKAHPDTGGTHELFTQLQEAYCQATGQQPAKIT